MEPYQADLVAAVRGLSRGPARLLLFSTVTGTAAGPDDFAAEYWGRNIRDTVRFAPAIDGLARSGRRLFVELGPHPVLVPAIRQCLAAGEHLGAAFASLRRSQSADVSMLTLVGSLYEHGRAIDWRRLYPRGGRCVRLPLTPWERGASLHAPWGRPPGRVPLGHRVLMVDTRCSVRGCPPRSSQSSSRLH